MSNAEKAWTTGQVRETFVRGREQHADFPGINNARSEFESWLSAHDLEVAERALEPIRAAEAEWRRTSRERADVRFRSRVLAALRSGAEPQDQSTPEYERATTTGPRKAWDDYDRPPDSRNGWEPDPDRPGTGGSWERFDYHEERYWRRKLSPAGGDGE